MPYPGGVGDPATQPAPYRGCLCLASVFFQVYEKLRNGNFFKKRWRFLGTFGGSPRSSPRGRFGFAKGKAKRTSVFVRVRALEGSEGSQKIKKQSVLFIALGNLKYKYKLCHSLEFQG